MKKLYTFLLLMIAVATLAEGQIIDLKKTDSLFRVNGEIYFRFKVFNQSEINSLSRIISIDKVNGSEVYAYANRKEFEKFIRLGYSIELLTPPGSMLKDSDLIRPAGQNYPAAPGLWNFYPTYQQYVDTMVYYAHTYPDLCILDTIGTLTSGRMLLVLKITKDVHTTGIKPQFFYTSTMHGDETVGYIGMLDLIGYILTGYGNNARITKMIDSVELYINPLANPDGTYHGGNNSVLGAIRYNANGVDLNRNYPDPLYGQHPDQNQWQQETVCFMNFADSNNFTMSANFHTGSEVFNYPWDDTPLLTADDSWWQFVGHEFADTCQFYGPSGYFTDPYPSGITDGYAWYQVTGGRQDYMNYFHNCRECTVELSSIKMPPASQLVNYWNYDYRSYLNYIEQVYYGIQGIVTDTVTGQPLKAKINIASHDIDSSFIFSRVPGGFYDRVIDEGTYDLTFSCPLYYSKTIKNVSVSHYNGVHLDVKLKPLNPGIPQAKNGELAIYPVPARENIHIVIPEVDSPHWQLIIYNSLGINVHSAEIHNEGKTILTLDMSAFPSGLYELYLSNSGGTYQKKILVSH
jgi:hypothetical protein